MNNFPLTYFIYARKSSEDSQRQVASIEDQVNALNTVVDREDLVLATEPFKEERSAKDPGRPIFNDVLNRIEKGEANALLCWDIDRLSRNPIDNGRLQWMLQKEVIKVIKTPGRSYFPEDAGLLMSIEGGRATDYVMRLSKNVKRGLNSKALRGWRPSAGPIGYINLGTEKGNKTIGIDPARFDLVRRMWDLFLTGTYSVSSIRKMATEEWGLRTLQRRKIGGKPMSMSHMYTIFSEPFYYGYFPWVDPETGEERLIKGNHAPMITEAEYWRAQTLLGKKGKQQPKTRDFAFTGLMRCGECGCSITAEEKNQLICDCKHKFAYENKTECPKCAREIEKMEHPKYLRYIYYRCTKKQNRNCTQKTVRIENLEEQFKKELMKITIDKDYLDLALDYLRSRQENAGKEEASMRDSLAAAFDSSQKRLTNLHREYTSPMNSNYELYTPEEFKKLKAEIVSERDQVESQLNKLKEKLDSSLEATERTFNFAAFALAHFNTDDLRKKRTIFSTIGSNLTLKDKKLNIERLHPYLLIENELTAQRKLYEWLEPGKDGYEQRKKAVFAASIPNWLRTVEAVRTWIADYKGDYYVPELV